MSDSENETTSSTLRIKLGQDVVEVQCNSTTGSMEDVDTIMIEIDENFLVFTEISWQILEENILAATRLQSVNIERLVQATTSIPVAVLTRLLRLPSMISLVDLRVLGTRLQGTKEEWTELAGLLESQNRPHLEYICLVEPVSWLQQIPPGALDPLVRVCSNHSRLKFVATNLFSGVSLEAIDDFCQSKQIAGVHLVDTDVSNERVFRFLKGMRTNTTVWFLSVAFSGAISAEHGEAFVDLLKENMVISNLSIKSKKPIQENLLFHLSKGLVHASVEEFSLEGTGEGPTISDTTRREISNMLEQNKCLFRFQIDGAVCDGLDKEIDMMVRLNRAGRKLLGNATTRQWVDVLSDDSLRDDLDCIFYLLSKNPELFCSKFPDTKAPSVTAPRKRKFGALEEQEDLKGCC